MPRHAQTSLSIHLRLPDSCRCCPEPLNGRYLTGTPPAGGVLGVLCVLESGGLCSPKIRPGRNLAVLAFGAISLRVLDLGARGTLYRARAVDTGTFRCDTSRSQAAP